ncbi:MAG: uracil-DNA glycosylase [Pseudomonadota bacterium]
MTRISDENLTEIVNYLGYLLNTGYSEIVLPEAWNPRESDSISPLLAIREKIGDCHRCSLSEGRTNLVFGEGSPTARLMFVGEGPGADEDREGRPFVGRAGQLLTRMIKAMGLERAEVYIANVVKCRPPGNRDPEQSEIEKCLPFLQAQIEAISPEVIVSLGRVAVSTLLGRKTSMTKIRGNIQYFNDIPLIPTYHPAFLLRKEHDRKWKAEAWADLKKVMAMLGLQAQGNGEST